MEVHDLVSKIYMKNRLSCNELSISKKKKYYN